MITKKEDIQSFNIYAVVNISNAVVVACARPSYISRRKVASKTPNRG